jgi:ribosomal-protein-alanine N-acetyltransferase
MQNNSFMHRNKIDKACFDTFPELKTERLIFREVTSADVEEIYKIYSDLEVAKFDWYRPIVTKDDALSIINRYKMEFHNKEEITWGVARKSDNKIIGYCNLGTFNDDSLRCEIGYGFNRDEWNKGYATEAIKALVKFGFEIMNFNRVEATVTVGNDASVKALKKADFIQEGIVRERTIMKGKFEDDVILAMLRKDYFQTVKLEK